MRTVPGSTDRVVVIGAGLGGLSAALHLAGAGRTVTILERAAVPGGRAGLIEDDGYRFDTGPTVLTMPDLLAQPLNAVGEDLDDWLTLHRLDPAYRARFADGSVIDVRADVDAMADEIAATCGKRDAEGYRRFVTYLTTLYRTEMPHFIDRNLDSPLALAGAPLARLIALGGFRRLAPKVAQFVTDERLQKLFSFQAMYAGLAPQQALAIYSVITYMDCIAGVYHPQGGMHAIPRALAAAAAKHGVDIRYDTEVTRIEVIGSRARAVITATGERIAADTIVVNADLPIAYADLLPDTRTPRRVRRLRYSPSAVVLHAGSTASYPDGAHHSIHFGTEWNRTFEQLIDRGELMSDPSFLVTNPTRTDPSLAPAARQTYYTLFPTPNLRAGIDWSEQARPVSRPDRRDAREERLRVLRRLDRDRAPGHPDGLAGAGHRGGCTVRSGTHLRPDRTVPPEEPRPPGRESRLRGQQHPARRRRADGADLWAARRRPDHRPMTPFAGGELDAAGIHDPALRAGYLRCRSLNARHGRTFFLATLLLPPAKRPYVHALYGFARHADDLVDVDPRADRAAHFQRWSEEFLADLDWGATSDPVARAVLDTARRWDLPHSYFADFLDAMRADLTTTSYPTYDDLTKYMWGSAAVIGLQMLPILGRADHGVPWDALEPHAIDLGYAFQLTNFIRDVAEDLGRGRVYLPQDSLDRFGVDRARLQRGRADEPIRNLLAWETERARELYRRAGPGVDLVHPSSRDCLRTAMTLYGGILDEIERADYDVFHGRVAVGLSRRARVGVTGLRAAVRARRADPPTPTWRA